MFDEGLSMYLKGGICMNDGLSKYWSGYISTDLLILAT